MKCLKSLVLASSALFLQSCSHVAHVSIEKSKLMPASVAQRVIDEYIGLERFKNAYPKGFAEVKSVRYTGKPSSSLVRDFGVCYAYLVDNERDVMLSGNRLWVEIPCERRIAENIAAAIQVLGGHEVNFFVNSAYGK